jgi:monoamine oxidase
MRRRAFLALAALGVWEKPARAQRASKSRSVIVVGAGLAGLAAAYELSQAGHEAVVLEARERAGGRVETLRSPFADGQYADAGGMFVSPGHALVLRYAERFGLSLQPALPPFHARLSYVRGQRVVTNWGGRLERLFDLPAADRELGYAALWEKYVAQGLASRSAEALDRLSVADLLRAQGAPAETVALLRVGYLDMMGDGIDSYSALHLQKRLAAAGNSAERLVIAGGAELLPKAFAGRLREKIRHGAAVVRIEPHAARPAVVVVEGGRRERISADHIVCTLPASVLRSLEVTPAFSAPKVRAVAALGYTSVLRVFMQFKEKAWTAENLYLLTTTDRPAQWIFDHTAHQPGRRGILEAQVLGAEARRLRALTEAERLDFALAQLEQVFPGVRRHFERGASKSWDDDERARGAFAYFRPGEMLSFAPELSRPEGRVHFAGDHTSAWSGWMQGALESGVRAALEVMEAA